MTLKTIEISEDLRVRINYDPEPDNPKNWDNLGEITYNGRSRYVLGTEGIDNDRFDEISRQVRDGKLIGIPVWAYVHSGSTIRAAWENPFGCPWDSGRSGWVYVSREKVLEEYQATRITKALRERVYGVLRAEVETFNQYLNGDVYGYMVERLVDGEWEIADSCWGFYGLKDCEEQGRAAAEALIAA